MNKLLLSIVVFAFVFTGCSKDYYLNSDFKKISANHQTLAILPVEMILTGQMPENMNDSDIEALEEAESKAFQKSLYNQIHWSPAKSKHLKVKFQSVEKTNEILGEHEISIRRTWKMTPEELAKLLEVDAVVIVFYTMILDKLKTPTLEYATLAMYGPNPVERESDGPLSRDGVYYGVSRVKINQPIGGKKGNPYMSTDGIENIGIALANKLGIWLEEKTAEEDKRK